MWNSIREAVWNEKEEDEDNNGAVGLQPVLVGSGQQNNEGFINIPGRAIASGNGPPIYAIIQNIRNYYGYPPLPSYEPPRPSLSFYRSSSKRAFLFSTIRGNDTLDDMKELLVKDFGFPIHCIRVIPEELPSPPVLERIFTQALESLKWLVKDSQPGDSLVFYFHGIFSGRKIPMGGKRWITEDEIKSTIVGPLKKGVTLHVIVDAHGLGDNDETTPFLDLNYVYKHIIGIYWNWEDNALNPIHNHTNGGRLICLSTWHCHLPTILTVHPITGKKIYGVLSYLLTKAIRDCPGITYSSLLNMMHKEIKILCNVVPRRGLALECPTLTSTEKFDVSTQIFRM